MKGVPVNYDRYDEAKEVLFKVLETQNNLIEKATRSTEKSGELAAEFCIDFIEHYSKYVESVGK